MYAVIETGGKQYRVSPGEEVKLEKLPGDIGDPVSFDKVLLTSDGENVQIGKPYVDNATVTGRLSVHGKERKIIIFKYKKRKGYRKKTGHRQQFTQVKIENIET